MKPSMTTAELGACMDSDEILSLLPALVQKLSRLNILPEATILELGVLLMQDI